MAEVEGLKVSEARLWRLIEERGKAGTDVEELDRRIIRLMESVAMMGADHDLDVVATSRYTFML